LAREGFRVTTAGNAAEARAKLDGLSFDLLVLDVMMPGESGFDLAKAIRTSSAVPILMLTARDETHDRIRGLELGADDYMAKPFEARELSLRITNILKRQQPAPAPQAESLKFGELIFHVARGELRPGEEVVHPTDRERDMPRVLADTPSRTAAVQVAAAWDWWGRPVRSVMPTGLYARSLLIIVTPMVILQSVVAFVFMERHWNTVTRRLSAAVTQDIASLIDTYQTLPDTPDHAALRRIAQQRLGLVVDFLPGTDLPPPGAKPFFSLLDQALSREI